MPRKYESKGWNHPEKQQHQNEPKLKPRNPYRSEKRKTAHLKKTSIFAWYVGNFWISHRQDLTPSFAEIRIASVHFNWDVSERRAISYAKIVNPMQTSTMTTREMTSSSSRRGIASIHSSCSILNSIFYFSTLLLLNSFEHSIKQTLKRTKMAQISFSFVPADWIQSYGWLKPILLPFLVNFLKCPLSPLLWEKTTFSKKISDHQNFSQKLEFRHVLSHIVSIWPPLSIEPFRYSKHWFLTILWT